MKELTLNEVKEVSGGFDWGSAIGGVGGRAAGSYIGAQIGGYAASWGGPIGTVAGAYIGYRIEHNIRNMENNWRNYNTTNIYNGFWNDQRSGRFWYGPY